MRKLLKEERSETQSMIYNTIKQEIVPLRQDLEEHKEKHDKFKEDVEARFRQLEATKMNPSAMSEQTSEIVIGGFDGKSREGAIQMCQELLNGALGGPTIVHEKMSNTPKIVTINFDSAQHARAWVEANKNNKLFELGVCC